MESRSKLDLCSLGEVAFRDSQCFPRGVDFPHGPGSLGLSKKSATAPRSAPKTLGKLGNRRCLKTAQVELKAAAITFPADADADTDTQRPPDFSKRAGYEQNLKNECDCIAGPLTHTERSVADRENDSAVGQGIDAIELDTSKRIGQHARDRFGPATRAGTIPTPERRRHDARLTRRVGRAMNEA